MAGYFAAFVRRRAALMLLLSKNNCIQYNMEVEDLGNGEEMSVQIKA